MQQQQIEKALRFVIVNSNLNVQVQADQLKRRKQCNKPIMKKKSQNNEVSMLFSIMHILKFKIVWRPASNNHSVSDMNSKTFFDNFETIASAPGGIARLRELILDLAVRGELVSSDPKDWKSSTLGEAVEIIRRSIKELE